MTPFPGFTERNVHGIHLVIGGEGPPTLLLHGYPQTHVMWRYVAPALAAAGRTVVCPDVRGYGRSHKPPSGEGAANYAKRVSAAELVDVMAQLGFERFAVAGHDRGGRVAYRMALDHPERVGHLATLDIVTTADQWAGFSGAAAVSGFHWAFLAQPHPFPETLIGADPGYFLRTLCGKWAARSPEAPARAAESGERSSLDEAMDHYVEMFQGEAIRASCDDYRAGATIDIVNDHADREAGRQIQCPTHVLWGDPTGKRPPLLDAWRPWVAGPLTGRPVRSGHFLAEENPQATIAELDGFLPRS